MAQNMDYINISAADASMHPVLQRMLEWLRKQPSIDVVQDGNNFVVKPSEDLARMLPGKPMSWEELEADLEEAEREYSEGKFITSEELLNDFKNW